MNLLVTIVFVVGLSAIATSLINPVVGLLVAITLFTLFLLLRKRSYRR